VPCRQPGPVLRAEGWSEKCDSYRHTRAGLSRQCRRSGARAVYVTELGMSGCCAGSLALTRSCGPHRVASNTRWCRPWRFTSLTTNSVLGVDFLCPGWLPALATLCPSHMQQKGVVLTSNTLFVAVCWFYFVSSAKASQCPPPADVAGGIHPLRCWSMPGLQQL